MSQAAKRLDLRGVRCPMNYIKTTLALETLGAGQQLEVLLDDGEAIKGIPMGVRDQGHEVLLTEPADPGYRLLIRKGSST